MHEGQNLGEGVQYYKKSEKFLFFLIFGAYPTIPNMQAYVPLHTQPFIFILFGSMKRFIDGDWIQTHSSTQQALKSKSEIDYYYKVEG